MLRFHRVARISRGKFLEAIPWSKEIAEYITAHFAPVKVQAYTELFGDAGAVHWYADYADLASVEKFNGMLLADQGYQALLAKAADLFIEGSVQDTLVQSI